MFLRVLELNAHDPSAIFGPMCSVPYRGSKNTAEELSCSSNTADYREKRVKAVKSDQKSCEPTCAVSAETYLGSHVLS